MRQSLQQKLSQKLSPRQIQLMKLIQIPEMEIDTRIKEEVESNPALEYADDVYDSDTDAEVDYESDTNTIDASATEDDITYDNNEVDYNSYEENPYEYYFNNRADDEEEDAVVPVKAELSFHDFLMQQMDMLDLSDEEKVIAIHIIGSIDDEGYLTRTAEEISDDLAFKENLFVQDSLVKYVIQQIQSFEPAGVGAYTLQECLILQLKRLDEVEHPLAPLAITILTQSFTEFSKKHYNKLIEKYKLSEEDLKIIVELILKLNPKPGNSFQQTSTHETPHYIIPDFFITIENDKINIALNDKNTPGLKISADFNHLLHTLDTQAHKSDREKETELFVKQKIDAAKWFMEALRQRKDTLLFTMKAIVEEQRAFFLSNGDPLTLKPMILKDIADKINMDISTVSRVSRSKYVQTPFGVYSLRFFFNDSYTNDDGEDVSIINIKNLLQEIIEKEDKRKPYSDQKLTLMLNEKGYSIARRTVAKYRDQLGYPVAQMRKELK